MPRTGQHKWPLKYALDDWRPCLNPGCQAEQHGAAYRLKGTHYVTVRAPRCPMTAETAGPKAAEAAAAAHAVLELCTAARGVLGAAAGVELMERLGPLGTALKRVEDLTRAAPAAPRGQQ